MLKKKLYFNGVDPKMVYLFAYITLKKQNEENGGNKESCQQPSIPTVSPRVEYIYIYIHAYICVYLFVPVRKCETRWNRDLNEYLCQRWGDACICTTGGVYKVARIRERWTVNQMLKNESNPEGKGIPRIRDMCFGRISTRLARDTNYAESQED